MTAIDHESSRPGVRGRVAVVYYSATGNVHALAQSVAQGAEGAGAEVRLRRGSYVISPFGETVATVPDFHEGLAVADLDLGLIDVSRLIWNHFGDDLRVDLFGGGPDPLALDLFASPTDAAPEAAAEDEGVATESNV